MIKAAVIISNIVNLIQVNLWYCLPPVTSFDRSPPRLSQSAEEIINDEAAVVINLSTWHSEMFWLLLHNCLTTGSDVKETDNVGLSAWFSWILHISLSWPLPVSIRYPVPTTVSQSSASCSVQCNLSGGSRSSTSYFSQMAQHFPVALQSLPISEQCPGLQSFLAACQSFPAASCITYLRL